MTVYNIRQRQVLKDASKQPLHERLTAAADQTGQAYQQVLEGWVKAQVPTKQVTRSR